MTTSPRAIAGGPPSRRGGRGRPRTAAPRRGDRCDRGGAGRCRGCGRPRRFRPVRACGGPIRRVRRSTARAARPASSCPPRRHLERDEETGPPGRRRARGVQRPGTVRRHDDDAGACAWSWPWPRSPSPRSFAPWSSWPPWSSPRWSSPWRSSPPRSSRPWSSWPWSWRPWSWRRGGLRRRGLRRRGLRRGGLARRRRLLRAGPLALLSAMSSTARFEGDLERVLAARDGRVRLTVGDVRAEAAVLEPDRLAADGIGVELLQRAGGAARAVLGSAYLAIASSSVMSKICCSLSRERESVPFFRYDRSGRSAP